MAEKPARQKAGEPDAVIAGTVFRDPGFALRGVEVVLTPSAGSATASNLKKQKTTTDTRGEFVFHVPAAAAKYVLSVSPKGMKAEEKPVSVDGGTRVDVTFVLVEESNK